jgi:hypothetical protein
LAGPDLGGGNTTLDDMARLGPAFAIFSTSLFDTSAFHFLIAACEASEPGRGQGAYGTLICSRTLFK